MYVGCVLIRTLNEGTCMHLFDVQSVLSDVYAADKVVNGGKIDSSAIAALIRKACTRRVRTSLSRSLVSHHSRLGAARLRHPV